MRFPRTSLLAVLVTATVALSACSSPTSAPTGAQTSTTPSSLSARDAGALATLAAVAPRTSTIDPTLAEWTECWLPSDHLIAADKVGNDTTFKVLCRVHWHQADGVLRAQDTTCIGDFAKDPMLDHCYRWVHYDLEPVFADHPAVFAGAAS